MKQKIVFDIDGTLTDFTKFVQKNAIPYFKRKYHMDVVDSNALEIQEIFDIQNTLIQLEHSMEEAGKIEDEMLNRFWVSHRFLKFSLLGRFRPEAGWFFRFLKRNGFDIEIHSSRSKTCVNNLVGALARLFTIWQCRLNGVLLSKNKIFFYKDDTEKVKGIVQACPLIVFEDKPWMIEQLAERGMKIVGISTSYNRMVIHRNVQRINSFGKEAETGIEKLLEKNWKCHKMEAASAKFFDKIKVTGLVIKSLFKPIILHQENILHSSKEGVIFAPNHRSTLDPLIIESILKENVHWALLRFFKGEDSIFNNSKSPILCWLTKFLFRKLVYFPIERKQDNPYANNMASAKNMVLYLKNGYKIGIFAEGTTRRPPGSDFGTFDDAFLRLAKSTNSWVQPITLYWADSRKKGSRVAINFGIPFKVENMEISEALDYFMKIQAVALHENQNYIGDIS